MADTNIAGLSIFIQAGKDVQTVKVSLSQYDMHCQFSQSLFEVALKWYACMALNQNLLNVFVPSASFAMLLEVRLDARTSFTYSLFSASVCLEEVAANRKASLRSNEISVAISDDIKQCL